MNSFYSFHFVVSQKMTQYLSHFTLQYMMTDNYSELVPLWLNAVGGTTLIVDSALDTGYDVAYDPDECTVILNERMTNDSTLISRLLIDCESVGYDDEFADQITMESAATSSVDHFSATTFDLYASTTSYYPGLSATFNYTVSDRLGNVIPDDLAENTTIALTVAEDSFVSLLVIDEDGECQICREGVWLSAVSLESSVGDNYTVDLSLPTTSGNDRTANDRLVLRESQLTFEITGCPASFGADPNNFTCTQCGHDEYNIDDHHVRECMPCDSTENTGYAITCIDCIRVL